MIITSAVFKNDIISIRWGGGGERRKRRMEKRLNMVAGTDVITT